MTFANVVFRKRKKFMENVENWAKEKNNSSLEAKDAKQPQKQTNENLITPKNK